MKMIAFSIVVALAVATFTVKGMIQPCFGQINSALATAAGPR